MPRTALLRYNYKYS